MSSTETGPDAAAAREDGGRTWSVLHAHLPPTAQSRFLSEAVAPYVEEHGLRGRFFFLRYWKGGPHIRLRFDDREAPDPERAGRLARAVPDFGQDLRDEYDGQAGYQAELARLEGEEAAGVRPLGTVEPAVYRPEYGKYGGPEGIRIAEDLFCATSAAVLDVLAVRGARSTGGPPVGESVRIMAMSLRGAGLDSDAMVAFLHEYEHWWRPFVPEGADRGWDGMYTKARDGLRDMCGPILDGAAADAFHDAYAEAAARARTVAGLPPGAPAAGIALPGAAFRDCLSHYLHTTNNRLGLFPAGEALAARLMRRCIEEL
ncbi:thiopeptide-type bacteriocin biosynthesis protein [Nocardiopsis suaedae]|uniref:Thiopeptide-type bacteriocin biosynthesis protein n=1 Tax=Nocardiopsis suaedae TaxID=3018444 RepID=A0ABT4TKQ0_9ACTN|nr:thiopeptide-type bacteriocin biosynthesis protein [Nocardiopsis suaedae]MDA2804672.1 thiopeptide-type bacteriocin biosynthesis protein [Nocardiopsis suaedae]